MGFQLLDLILIGIMLISGVLALMRGFTREVLSLAAWGLAALAAYYAIRQPNLIELALPYVDKPVVAQIAVGGLAFLVVLIVVSVIMVKISDLVVDSSAGAFDRSMGFIYGLVRGLVLVAIAFLFYGWLLPYDKQEVWVRDAKSLPMIKKVGETLLALMPPDIAETFFNTALANNPDQAPVGTKSEAEPSYQNNTTQGLDNLIQGTGEPTPQPGFGQDESQ